MREFSFPAIILGVIIGALLAAANAFVGLKIGMTISASIPAAVMSLVIMRTLLKRKSILESNMVQTIGSAGESVAAGMIFTIPAIFIIQMDPAQNPAYLSMVIWGAIGGLLGVCFMVPLRHVLIVKEHGVLPYPEGVACAQVLESGERGGGSASAVIWGAIVGAVYYLFNGLGFFGETGRAPIKRFRTEFQLDSSPALLGIGYILGPRIAAYMLGGAVLSWFVLIPSMGFFGAEATTPIYPQMEKIIPNMSPSDLYESYIRYIGAGAVAIGGLISLFKSFPTIIASLWHVATGIFGRGGSSRARTEKDLPFSLVLLIIGGLGYAMWEIDQVGLNHIGVIAVVIFTFFFVTVSSRLVGLVGQSSNPVSGMTIATLLGTALVFKFFVLDQAIDPGAVDLMKLKVTCLSVGAIVCIAISVAGDTSQDLKTGFLLKATPYKQQMGEMIGVLTSVLAVSGVILLLNDTQGFVKDVNHPHPLLAPQANIMKILVEGVLGGNVPWTLILIGGAVAVIVEMLGLPALPFAVGMYLPLGLSTPIMVGGIVAWVVNRKKKTKKNENDLGVLAASGLVAGKGLMGVLLAVIAAIITAVFNSRWLNPLSGTEEPVTPVHLVPWIWSKIDAIPLRWGLSQAWWDALPMFPFAALVVWLWWCARKRPTVALPPTPTPTPRTPIEPIAPTTPPVVPPPSDEPKQDDEPQAIIDDQSKWAAPQVIQEETPPLTPSEDLVEEPAQQDEPEPIEEAEPATAPQEQEEENHDDDESLPPSAGYFGPPEPLTRSEVGEDEEAADETGDSDDEDSAEADIEPTAQHIDDEEESMADDSIVDDATTNDEITEDQAPSTDSDDQPSLDVMEPLSLEELERQTTLRRLREPSNPRHDDEDVSQDEDEPDGDNDSSGNAK